MQRPRDMKKGGTWKKVTVLEWGMCKTGSGQTKDKHMGRSQETESIT